MKSFDDLLYYSVLKHYLNHVWKTTQKKCDVPFSELQI